jgi:acetoin utilization deacetylase AcuC-like enzyme
LNKILGITAPEECAAHDSPVCDPEGPERLKAVKAGLKEAGHWNQDVPGGGSIEPREALTEDLALVHTPEHLDRVREACASSLALAYDTGARPGTWRAALFAAGSALAAADQVADGRVTRAFCAIRPPGHHAGPGRAMGFCFFNNIAVAARHLMRRRAFKRIAVVDFDAHHGNGTQEIFRDDPGVLYCSLHQFGADQNQPWLPYYPGTGGRDLRLKDGRLAALNCPLPAGTGWPQYEEAFTSRIIPEFDSFAPEILLLSAGFDAHRADPLSQLNLETQDFGRLTRIIVSIAVRLCRGRIVSVLEGGYNLKALSASIAAHVRALEE